MTSAARWLMMCALAVGAALGPVALPARAVALPARASAPQSAPSAQRTPLSDLPPDRVPSLSGVSCPSASRCLVVGSIFGVAGSFPSSLIWNGRSWRALRTPGGASLAAVSCATAIACVAVGAQAALAWNGTRWRTLKPAPKPGQAITLTGVSCQAASRCVAVGFWGSRFTLGGTVAEVWNGTRWRLLSTPDPAGAVSSSFAGVSCASAASCVAVGESFTGGQVVSPLAESWNGHSWTILATAGWNGGLASVSCPSISRCMAVGHAGSMAADVTLAQEWNGTSWRLLTTVNDGMTGLGGVWCTSTSACIAVGSVLGAGVTKAGNVGGYQDSNSAGHNLALRWTGTRWRIVKIGGPPGLQSVSCPAASGCMAIGNYLIRSRSGSLSGHNLAEAWNGRTWRIVRTAGQGGRLASASCTSPRRCMAIGQARTLTMAEIWNGLLWRLLRTPNP